VEDFSNEPAVKDRATIETRVGLRVVVDQAIVANVTADEVWVVVDAAAAERLVAGSGVRVAVTGADGRSLNAETTVRRTVGRFDRMIALARPREWTSPSRRVNGRARLAIPAYLRTETDGTVASAQTTNVSVGGFHCVTALPLSVGDELEVSLMFKPTDAFECRAQVVRLNEDASDPLGLRLVAAFRFVDLSEAGEACVAEALAALRGETDPAAVPTAYRTKRDRARSAG